MLMEVENDNIGYDQRIVWQKKYQPCGTLQTGWADSAEF